MGILDLFRKKEQYHRKRTYLIEFRLSGYAKYTIIKLRESIEKNFDLEKDRKPPHITLVGELETDDEKQLVKQVVEACKQYKLVRFKLDGVGSFPKPVIYAGVKQSAELEDLRLDMVRRLKPFCTLKNI